MNRVNLLMCFFSLCLLAGCSQESAEPDATNGTTVAVTREIRVGLLPMQEVTTLDTRSTSEEPLLSPKGEDKTGLRGTSVEKRESLHVSYGKVQSRRISNPSGNVATRAQSDSVDMTPGELTLKNAYIVQFSGTDPSSTAAWVSGDVKSQLSSGTAITCNFVMTAGVKNRVYVVANVAAAPSKGMTLATFETPVTYTVSSSLPTIGGTQCLPMSAMQDVGVGDTFEPFRVKSLLGKLQLTCKTSGATLKLKGVPSGYSFYRQSAGNAAVRPEGMTYNNSGVTLTSGATYYIPENLSGRNDLLIKHVTRALGMAPANALYVEITNSGTVYNLLLGDGSANDFNFVGGYAYSINATIYGTDAYDLRVGNPVSSITDLNADGQTANCYIATNANAWYMFNNTVMGNGATTPVPADLNAQSVAAPIIPKPLNPVDADVLWETLNTTTSPVKGDVVTANLYFLKDRILFRSGAKEGNAVIAARDAQNNIVWSWHIWRMNTDPRTSTFTFPTYTATSGNFDDTGSTSHPGLTMMTYNIGALSNAAKSDLSTGLHYQWGRKDPMPAYAGLATSSTVMATQPAGIPIIPSSEAQYTVEQSIQQPATFLKYGSDWCSTRNDNLWGTAFTGIVSISNGSSNNYNSNYGSKSTYDPCPVGWRIPPGYAYAILNTTNFAWDASGRSYSSVWFPASGYRSKDYGTLVNVGYYGYCWTATPLANYPAGGSSLFFYGYGVTPSDNGNRRSYGYSCRCVKE